MFTVYRLPFTVVYGFTVYGSRVTDHGLRFTVYGLQLFTICSLLFTVCSCLQSALYSLQFTVCGCLQFAVTVYHFLSLFQFAVYCVCHRFFFYAGAFLIHQIHFNIEAKSRFRDYILKTSFVARN